MTDFRQHSRDSWSSNSSSEHINAGSLQRIADATEKMASNYAFLQNERDKYERWYKHEQAENRRLRNQAAGLRGYIHRLKNKGK